jgi:hypothetical protein
MIAMALWATNGNISVIISVARTLVLFDISYATGDINL